MKGPEFLKKKYNLHSTSEVKAAATRTQRRSGEKVAQNPDAQIQNYLDRFSEILKRKDEKAKERGLAALKEILHKELIIKKEDVPESYFNLQRRIAVERGHGDVKITDAERAHHIEVIRSDQANSLDAWIDELASNDAYADWFKYYVLRNIGALSEYDTTAERFGKRTKDTVKLFPDLNSEALSYMYDTALANGNKEKNKKKTQDEGAPESLSKPLSPIDTKLKEAYLGGDFGKFYAVSLEKATAKSAELFPNTEGEWIRYNKGSDHIPLVRSLQTRGTGWCTAGVATAESQLSQGDFYVYYSLDAKRKPVLPRVAIRMQGNSIAEVRGVGPQQNLDQYIAPVVKQKLGEFPDGKLYEKKFADMAELTRIAKKDKALEELTQEELVFLYEKDEKIVGFGQVEDPRIRSIKSWRNYEADMMKVYEVDKAHCAFSQADIREGTILFAGYLTIDKETVLPDSLRHIEGQVTVDHFAKDLPESLALKLIEAGKADIVGQRLGQFQSLSAKVAHTLSDKGYANAIATHLGAFKALEADMAIAIINTDLSSKVAKELMVKVPPEDHPKVARAIIETNRGIWGLIDNLSVFKNISHQEIVDAIIANGKASFLRHGLHKFKNLNKATAEKMIAEGYAESVAKNLESFTHLDEKIAHTLVQNTFGEQVLYRLKKFEPFDDMELARELIRSNSGGIFITYLTRFVTTIDFKKEAVGLLIEAGLSEQIAQNLESLYGVDDLEVARAILNSKEGERVLHRHLHKFKGLDLGVAQMLHTQGTDRDIINNIESFKPEDHAQIALMLLSNKTDHWFIGLNFERFQNLTSDVAEQMLQQNWGHKAVERIDKFGELSLSVDGELLKRGEISLQTYLARLSKRAFRTVGIKTSLALTREDLSTRKTRPLRTAIPREQNEDAAVS